MGVIKYNYIELKSIIKNLHNINNTSLKGKTIL